MRTKQRNWYQRNKASVRACTDANKLKREFGVSVVWYLEQWQAQSGRCALCRRPEQVRGRRLAVDHDHKTGLARKLLCFKCNRLIGLANENPTTLRAAAEYVEAV